MAYAEAIKYTPNVVKVYSPNATWAKVKAAVVGASIVIYLGHGNGWPSPYTYDPKYTTKDGFGLNATAGAGDYNNKYYGEPYVATLDLAPNAVVILNHLCYASGNSEPGNAGAERHGRPPARRQLRRRASSRPAPRRSSPTATPAPSATSGALFTTHQSVEDMWRTMPNRNGNVVNFASMRTPGATVFQDPITPTSGFYRSLAIGTIGVTTDEVVSAGYGDTGANPTDLVVPGNAAVTTDGAGLYSGLDTPGAPPRRSRPGRACTSSSSPPRSTRAARRWSRSQGIDDPSIAGFMVATRPRAARQHRPDRPRPRPGRPVLARTATGRSTRPPSAAASPRSVAWTLRVRDDAGHESCSRRPGTGSHVPGRLGRAGQRRSRPGRHLHR